MNGEIWEKAQIYREIDKWKTNVKENGEVEIE